MPFGQVLSKIFSTGAKDLVDSVTGGLDKLITNKEELALAKIEMEKVINSHTEAMGSQAIELAKVEEANTADARAMNTAIQGDKPSWLSKNVAYMIDIFIIVLWGFMTVYLLMVMLRLVQKQTGVDYTAITAIWGGVSTIAGTIINFHRGSSRNSQQKDQVIQKIAMQP